MVALPQSVWDVLRMHSWQAQESARHSGLQCVVLAEFVWARD